jgi:hypothetical protein
MMVLVRGMIPCANQVITMPGRLIALTVMLFVMLPAEARAQARMPPPAMPAPSVAPQAGPVTPVPRPETLSPNLGHESLPPQWCVENPGGEGCKGEQEVRSQDAEVATPAPR